MASTKPNPAEPASPAEDTSPPQGSQNWAVVSFLLEDAVWCDWLYREFDGQRIPRTLLGRPSRFGLPYPERISVSPDPSDPEQLETYAETIQNGQHLVVVVSPASGQSPVIEEHLKSFRAAGGEERIICLVVKGEPASAAAEPGTQADEAWLPKWLKWRFHNNRFSEPDPLEPLVIDARLGVASLAEVRDRLMAALLEIDRARLPEFSIFNRSAMHLLDMPSAVLSSAMRPQPSNVTFNSIASDEAPAQRHSRWPVWAVAVGAFFSLVCLAYWPDRSAKPAPAPTPLFRATPPPPDIGPIERIIPENESLVEAQPVGTPLSDRDRPSASAPKVRTPVPTPQTPPPAAAGPAQPQLVVATAVPAAGANTVKPAGQKHQELVVRRDRLVALGESRLASGDAKEALEIFEDALGVFTEIAAESNQTPNDVLDLCAMHRRLGALSESQRSLAEARGHYETARKTLAEWRAKSPLPTEAARLLTDVEENLRQLRKP